VTIGE
jgi:hypothetical protein